MKQPTFNAPSFNCPHCGVLATMTWDTIPERGLNSRSIGGKPPSGRVWFSAECANCNQVSMWLGHNKEGIPTLINKGEAKICYPRLVSGEPASEYMPNDVRVDYEEARLVAEDSPRAAAALLRLCVQRLCIHLGKEGKNINKDIKELVKEHLSAEMQQAMDIVRVIGNNAVHPGTLAAEEMRESVAFLFKAVQRIVEDQIEKPQRMAEMYDMLPESAKVAIQVRDSTG